MNYCTQLKLYFERLIFMGLFDKLKEVVGNAIESSMNGHMNEQEKKYYDIILNLLLCVPRLQKEHVQKFIKTKYNEEPNEVTLDKVLEKFNSITTPKTHGIWYQLPSTQNSRANYKDGGLSWFKEEEIYDICFDDFREEIRSKFREVFEIVQENPSKKLLEQGIKKITTPISGYYIAESNCPNFKIAIKVITEELLKHFFIGNDLICDIAADMVLSRLQYNYTSNDSNYNPRLYAVALHALHYAKSVVNETEYVSITKEDCASAVHNSKFYNKKAEENPFNKDAVYQSAVNEIFDEEILHYSFTNNYSWENLAAKNICFVDGACFHAWSKVAEWCGKNTDDVEEAVLMINHYIKSNVD